MSRHDLPEPPQLVRGHLMLVDMFRGSYRELTPEPRDQSSRNGSGAEPGGMSGARQAPTAHEMAAQARDAARGLRPMPAEALQPWNMAAEFPEMWSRYIRAHFHNHYEVARAFTCSERAAKKWWDGIGSCRGDKVAMACRMHPETAPQMLFGIAAE